MPIVLSMIKQGLYTPTTHGSTQDGHPSKPSPWAVTIHKVGVILLLTSCCKKLNGSPHPLIMGVVAFGVVAVICFLPGCLDRVAGGDQVATLQPAHNTEAQVPGMPHLLNEQLD